MQFTTKYIVWVNRGCNDWSPVQCEKDTSVLALIGRLDGQEYVVTERKEIIIS